MARFAGKIGFAIQEETAPSVFEDVITERAYFGDLVKNSLKRSEGEPIHPDISLGHSVSIVADAYAFETYFAMRYVVISGTRWSITNIDVERPRLTLRIGGVYYGPTPTPDP